jgi:AcrR family transcriptional regulator
MGERASAGGGLRQRTREAVRQQIAATALVMFDEQGFDETTVDQIVAAVDISPRSFFRYFATKEDVVLGEPMAYVEPVRERLVKSLETMPVWDALRAGFEAGVILTNANPEGALRATRIMINTPSLRARNTEKHLVWMTVLTPLVADSLPGHGEDKDFQARAVTLAALTCLDASSAEWVIREAAVDFGQLLDETFALLKPAVLRD